LECNDDCKQKNGEKQRVLEEEERKAKEAELEKNLKEMEEFEKKFAKKKQRERKQRTVEETEDNSLHKWILAGCVLVSIISVVLYFTLAK
jgi:cytochrome c-type biogenesis protein CcmH/NrfG